MSCQESPAARASATTAATAPSAFVALTRFLPYLAGAAAYVDPALRSLDAIHLATAQTAASTAPLTARVTYDSRLREAADTLGLTTAAPGKHHESVR
jgi:uncharacterized protein